MSDPNTPHNLFTYQPPAPLSTYEAGMIAAESAADNAEAQSPGWKNDALALVSAYIARNPGQRFRTEQVRVWAQGEMGLEAPPTNRAWGSVMVRAAKLQIIRKVGVELTTIPPAHATYVAVWQAPTPADYPA